MRVLIVDDIFTNRLLLAEILQNLSIDYDQAEDGKQAIEALEKQDYDLILMDVEMPVMNGLETTVFIREKMPYPKNRTPIVALTAHNPELFFQDFKDVGFDKLFAKPYNLQRLAAIIQELNI